MSAAVLAGEDLAKSFGGVAAVRGVSFAVGAGEMVALIGPNGAGKTTLFNLLGGQLRPDRGRVRLSGRDVTGAPPRALCRLGAGRTFQVARPFDSMLVRESVQVALLAASGESWGAWRPLAWRRAEEAEALLVQLGLAALAERSAGQLAYGDRKRLDLALALAGAPRALLLDEPTAGMAPGERGALMRLVREQADARGLAVLFTEHDMGAVFGFAGRVLVMDRGALIAEGPPEAVRADARVREAYLGPAEASSLRFD